MVLLVDWFIDNNSRSPGILEVRGLLLNHLFACDLITPGGANEYLSGTCRIFGVSKGTGATIHAEKAAMVTALSIVSVNPAR